MGQMLPYYHVLQKPLDDEISRRAWTNLVTYYDFDHTIFLQSDLDNFSNRLNRIDDEIRIGDVSFGFEVFRVFCERIKERVDFATNLIASTKWDFSTHESYSIKRSELPWPKTKEEAENLWRKRMKNEMLVRILARELDKEKKAKNPKKEQDESKKSDSKPEKIDDVGDLVKKYRQYLSFLTESDEEEVLQHYLSAVARAYDPHTDYMSPATKEDFEMEMNLTLCGVGAVLQMDDGALKIVEVMPGGPVDKDGRISAGDKIIGVKQGDSEMEDVMWQPMKKTIKKIRGPKGSRVTLQIIPRSDPTGATKKNIELIRDEIKLEDLAATGKVETVTLNGVSKKLGYVYLPAFYGTMGKKPGEPGYRSCADDISKYVSDFNASGVEGMILDLRGDGGGSLQEAIRLSELFVPSGPVVQIRDASRVIPLSLRPRKSPAYRKPVLVLIDRASASASEIVAGHLKDVGRAIVAGDCKTHGKGTVQTVLEMGPQKFGSMKITTARFYRVNGSSTQVKGVESDIHLPSLLDSLDIGEDKLKAALPFTRIRKAAYQKYWNLDSYVPILKERLDLRHKSGDAAYLQHLRKVAAVKAISDREYVSLEYETRKKMMVKDRLANEDVDSEEEEEKKNLTRRGKAKVGDREKDVVLNEAFSVLHDMVSLSGGEELPEIQINWLDNFIGF
jgi:carboxyl-terminal processing protease